MRDGRCLGTRPALAEIRDKTRANLERMPEKYKGLSGAPHYPVAKSAALERLLEAMRERYFKPVASDKP
jgi:hypothetical protein